MEKTRSALTHIQLDDGQVVLMHKDLAEALYRQRAMNESHTWEDVLVGCEHCGTHPGLHCEECGKVKNLRPDCTF